MILCYFYCLLFFVFFFFFSSRRRHTRCGRDWSSDVCSSDIHIGMTAILFIVILLANAFKEQDVINTLFILAGYTYGPLLGLFFFGIISKRVVDDHYTWIVCLIVPVLIYIFKSYEQEWFDGYKSGHEILGVNGLLCYLGLWIMSSKPAVQEIEPLDNTLS